MRHLVVDLDALVVAKRRAGRTAQASTERWTNACGYEDVPSPAVPVNVTSNAGNAV
jgi:hypothetical protein